MLRLLLDADTTDLSIPGPREDSRGPSLVLFSLERAAAAAAADGRKMRIFGAGGSCGCAKDLFFLLLLVLLTPQDGVVVVVVVVVQRNVGDGDAVEGGGVHLGQLLVQAQVKDVEELLRVLFRRVKLPAVDSAETKEEKR